MLPPAAVTDAARPTGSWPSPAPATCWPSRLTELPELDKGKGNKLIQIPPAKLKSGEEKVVAVAERAPGRRARPCTPASRSSRLSWRDLQAYEGTRATRGHLLPRGYTRVDRIEAS